MSRGIHRGCDRQVCRASCGPEVSRQLLSLSRVGLERCVNFSNGIFASSFTVLLHAPSLGLRFQRALAEIREITDETAATTTIAAAKPTAIFQSPSTGLGIT
jgi:hypothetical protein